MDRIGAKAELVSMPIEVYFPYIGGTQDEKQYRVVMDRERWFQVLMGEEYRTDELYTERWVADSAASRAAELWIDLSVKLVTIATAKPLSPQLPGLPVFVRT